MRFFLNLFFALLVACSLHPAMANFQGFNGDSNLKLFNKVKCDAGLTCSRTGQGVFEIDVTDSAGSQTQVSITTSPTTLTSSQCASTVLGGDADETVNLPEASTVLGCRFTFIVNGASTLTVNPDDADQILLLTNAAGDATAANAAGESVVLEAISASQWAPVGAEKGTWSDVD